jgi:hypothetical protein
MTILLWTARVIFSRKIKQYGCGVEMCSCVRRVPCNVTVSHQHACTKPILILASIALLIIYDTERLTVDMVVQALSLGRSIHPRQADSDLPPQVHSIASSNHHIDIDMDIDDEELGQDPNHAAMNMIEHVHPLDELHEQVVCHFQDLLRDASAVALKLQLERNKSDPGGLFASKHAPKLGIDEGTLPTEGEIQLFTCKECIQLLSLINPPVAVDRQADRRQKPAVSELARISNFLTPPYNPGARRGQDWTRGDWRDSLNLIEKLGKWWQQHSLCESVGICRPVLEFTFTGLDGSRLEIE